MKKILLITAGTLALLLGVVGAILPVLPTTPFVLLAAVCFSKSNQRMEAWLANSRLFGAYIENYRAKTGISRLRKICTLVFLWAGLGVSMFLSGVWWLYLLLPAVGVGVSVHILMIRTRKN